MISKYRTNDKIMHVKDIVKFTGRSVHAVRRWFSSGELRRLPRLGAACWFSDLVKFLETGDARKIEAQANRAAHARRFRKLAPAQAAQLDAFCVSGSSPGCEKDQTPAKRTRRRKPQSTAQLDQQAVTA